MATSPELDRLRARIDLIEHELSLARRQLDALSAAHKAPTVEAARPAPAVPPALPSLPTEPEAVPDWDLGRRSASVEPVVPPPVRSSAPVRSNPPSLPAPPPTPVGPGPLRIWLERLQLWPPSGEGNREVTLGAWWATRVGALLAVIGVVFFGVYISVGTPPWVKFVELLAVAFGVSVFGGWLERKLPTFGSVVLGSGLALIFFSAFAAYSVPAVKVVDGAGAAASWQLLAAGAILTMGWRRSSPVVATMAVVFGFVAAFFSFSAGLTLYALVAALLLSSVAVALAWVKNWEGPSVLALPLAYLMYACTAFGVWTRPAGAVSPEIAWSWLAALFALFFARDFVQAGRAPTEPTWASRRFYPTLNSSLAALVGVGATLFLYPGSLDVFYFGSGAVLLVAGLAWRRRAPQGALVALLWCKASGLIALGVITAFDTRTRWLVLLVQAAVLLVSARRSGVRVLRLVAVAAWLAAAGFLAADLLAPGYAWRSLTGLAALGFVVGSALLAGWWERGAEPAGLPREPAVIAGLAVGVIGVLVAWPLRATGWMPALTTLGVVAFAGYGQRGGVLSALVAAGVLWFGAVVGLMFDLASPGYALFAESGVASLVFLILSAGVSACADRRRNESSDTIAGDLRGAGLALVTAATAWHWQDTGWMPALAIMVAAALAVGGVRARWRSWLLAAGVMVVVAHAGMLTYDPAASPRGGLWLNESVLVLADVVGIVALGRALASQAGGEKHGLLQAASVLAVLGVVVLVGVFFNGLSASVALTAATGVGLALLVVAPIIPVVPLQRISPIPLVLGMVLTVGFAGNHTQSAPSWLMATAVLAWLPPIGLVGLSGWARLAGVTKPAQFTRGVHMVAATLVTLIALPLYFDHDALPNAFAVAAALIFVAEWRLRLGGAAAVVTLFLVCGVLTALPSVGFFGEAREAGAFWWIAALVLGLFTIPVVRRRAGGGLRSLAWMQGVMGLGVLFLFFLHQRGSLQPYVTVGWGTASIAVFLAGLFTRERAYRLLGLAGLAVCIPRVFLIDIDSTLYRIAAFVALGGVLLWVGFSYHRFRHLVVDQPEPASKP